MAEETVTEETGKIARAAGVVGFFTLLSRIAGLLRDIIVGYLFGSQGAADAFFVAFRIPNLLRRLTAEGALTVAFVPVFTNYLAKEGKAEAAKVAHVVFTFVALVLAAITLLGILFAEPIARFFAPGFLDDPRKFSLTVHLTRLMFPYIFFVSLVALSMGVLNAVRHFMAPALSPVLFNVCIVVCATLLARVLSEPVLSLAYGVLLGGMAQLALQLPYLSRYGFAPAPNFHFGHPALRRLAFLMGPAVFGAAVHQINILVSTILASLLPAGSVSYLYYADRLLEFPVGVFAIALGTAALPSFSFLLAKGDTAGLRSAVVHSLKLVNFISLPATFGLIAVAVPVFAILFQRGAFDAVTTVNTAQALVYYAFGLWGISGAKLLAPVFYAMEDMKTPVRIAFLSFLLNLLLSLVFMGPVTVDASSSSILAAITAELSARLNVLSLRHAGLALATAVSSTFNFLALLVVLHHRLNGLPLGEVAASFARNLLNALLMALPLFWIAGNIDWVGPQRNLYQLSSVFVALVALGVMLYLVFSRLLGSPEWPFVRQLIASLAGRIRNLKIR
ncbi:MAG: murein biosynthesis integral membrane protein MurJ [Candidatus Binatia bacterium]